MSYLARDKDKAEEVYKRNELQQNVNYIFLVLVMIARLTMTQAIHRLEKMVKSIGRDVTAVHSTVIPVLTWKGALEADLMR